MLTPMTRYLRHGGRRTLSRLICFPIALYCLIRLLLFFSFRSSSPATALSLFSFASSRCDGRYVFMHDLPPRFNADLLRDNCALSPWVGDACHFADNGGFGTDLGDGWYVTSQFALEFIFHDRMRRYECLTGDPARAAAFFVPFYAGVELLPHLWGTNTTVRDAVALDLVRWLRARPEWAAMGGRDHFMVAGRITWDFRRQSEEDGDWGSKLFWLPELQNMTTLLIESSPWQENDVAIPYPTYFHPSTAGELAAWQNRVRHQKRPWLFSFAGAPRPNNTDIARDVIIQQCRASPLCKLLDCAGDNAHECFSPRRITELFSSSVFCLQPLGDSYTRRSAFDAMVGGCIPVFFHPGSAYVQYVWHLPRDFRNYSVFIPMEELKPGNGAIERTLSRISPEQASAMREAVVGMMPSLVYGNKRTTGEEGEFKDAFDLAVEKVIERVEKRKRDTKQGIEQVASDESYNWKKALLNGGVGWEHYFNQK
ncbi:hypothetical protein ZIOFF_036880 [Zingiber officinale]|uniref:Exostosin GT47 domain-containing protein n=2 Tax=Zingiber officinale TaxID=94328 RepID=A0A8J5GCI9_ZINOF|nr:hypothetical protein ZIOFF_036880 [Zingiber officinale]